MSNAAILQVLPGILRRGRDGGCLLRVGGGHWDSNRYLYRAWKSGDVQGRGLHFLRTYLQMLFPNECEVEQLWHDKESPYPTALYTTKPSFAWPALQHLRRLLMWHLATGGTTPT